MPIDVDSDLGEILEDDVATDATVAGEPCRGLLRDVYVEDSETDVEGYQPALRVRSAELSHAPEDDDDVAISARTFKIRSVQPSPQGNSYLLILEEITP